MCLVLFGFKVSKSYPLVLAANRDEFYQRPSAAMDFWENHPQILAGKDLEKGGTWFGIDRRGCFAALTNFRDPANIKPNAPSRGNIIIDFLKSRNRVHDFLERLKKRSGQYNGFNLLAGSISTEDINLYWFSNRNQKTTTLEPGIHGLSNHLMDTAWPKVSKGKNALARAIAQNRVDNETLFSLLADSSIPHENLLPDTGIGLEWERILSPLFIKSPTYGTRSSTIMRINHKGRIEIAERRYLFKGPNQFRDQTFTIQTS